ncbi:endonuclease/exonuclease/phosphatase family protein [Kordia jejudonensis]|uniref:endonuclease/exonuclease/phosphatase family protein n=1 Tax=Kordia jejudonensis TaxID=1348245 RepID=UPI000628FE4E|nr:endonuclease/exonuclease/phosphatase family protein [Kordia jejudonensis]
MKLKKYVKKALQLFLCIATVIHFTIKDTYYISSLLFYATPLLLIILGVLFLLLFIKASARKYYVVLIALLTIIWIKNSFVFTSDSKNSDGLEIVLWNAYRTESFEDAFQENGAIPDVAVLIESDLEKFEKAKKTFPNDHFYFNDYAIGIFSKTPINIKSSTTKEHVTIVHFSTNNIDFYAVDVSANIKFFRKPMLKNILSRVKTTQKTIILGDFNTPYASLFFKNYKKNYQHAFAEKGNGFLETWFWNFPLLSLDHIWVSQDLQIQKTEKISTWKSDHSLLKMYLKNAASKK